MRFFHTYIQVEGVIYLGLQRKRDEYTIISYSALDTFRVLLKIANRDP